MNSIAFSLLANSNPEVDEIQIPFETIDFQPHQSSFTQVFESMDQDMDLTIVVVVKQHMPWDGLNGAELSAGGFGRGEHTKNHDRK
jgi:hypothetical protein